MTSTLYRPGPWLGIKRSGAVVILAPGTDPGLVTPLWESLADAPSVDGILNEITHSFGTALTAMPPFGIVLCTDRLHVVLRGEVTLTALHGDEETVVSGRDVSTWSERTLPLPDGYELSLGGYDDGESALGARVAWLPLGDAVVLLSGLADGTPLDETSLDEAPPWAEDDEAAGGSAVTHEGPGPEEEPDAEAGDLAMEADETEADEAAYATFAQAADAEWSAELDGPDEDEPSAEQGGAQAPYEPEFDEPEFDEPEFEELESREPESGEPEFQAPESAGADSAWQDSGDSGPGHAVAPMTADDMPPLPPTPPTVAAVVPDPAAVQHTDADDGLIDAVPWRHTPAAGMAQPIVGPFDVPQGAPVDAPAESAGSRPPTGPSVLARLCPQGHANPPQHSSCALCGLPITTEAQQVAQPSLGRMHLSTGEVIDLDHSLVIGRHPSVSRVPGGAMPRLVQVEGPGGDISRSHVEVRLEGWDAVLVDLEATNGTVLLREGQEPRRLDPGEEVPLVDGDVAELGEGVWLSFEGLR
ncbi:FHA domain-containing protein [Specibacter cremeus]|uniref:FHA domain-containing protein n=1 Tax=Specibacter cremeus TaxID=1629051 RepID=UPI000F78E3ED|nr:FHA domain-containing protein [Specibacter cremeus]